VVSASFLATAVSQDKADEDRAFALGVPYTSYNWKMAHANQRGCNACHADQLAETVSNMTVRRAKPPLHGIFVIGQGIAFRVEDCQICHTKEDEVSTAPEYADTIHSVHLFSSGFTGMGGSCESCHVSSSDFKLYDDNTRYNLLNGITLIPTPEFK
jgi:hypothetical protein